MEDFSAQWKKILARHRRGRKLLLLHLLLFPAVVYLLGYVFTRMNGGNDPVWFYIVSFVCWIVGFVFLTQRHEPYLCPRCATKVYPSGAVSLLPLPCSKCGLKMPLVER